MDSFHHLICKCRCRAQTIEHSLAQCPSRGIGGINTLDIHCTAIDLAVLPWCYCWWELWCNHSQVPWNCAGLQHKVGWLWVVNTVVEAWSLQLTSEVGLAVGFITVSYSCILWECVMVEVPVLAQTVKSLYLSLFIPSMADWRQQFWRVNIFIMATLCPEESLPRCQWDGNTTTSSKTISENTSRVFPNIQAAKHCKNYVGK